MSNLSRSYEVRLATPAFIAGADPRSPELRASSIRGLLRWWFRLARLGEGLSPKEIYQHESELFGAPIPQIGQRALIRVRPNLRIGTTNSGYEQLPFNHKYLWFSMRGATRRSLSEGTVFAVETRVPPHLPDAEQRLDRLEETLLHWVLFGGIGLRSRRCAGSVWFNRQLPDGSPLPAGKEAIEKTLREHRNSLPVQLTVSARSFTSWKAAVEDAGKRYRGRRWDVRRDRGRRVLPMLGWPIANFPGINGNDIRVDGRPASRLASPVMLKIIPDDASYRWLLVVLSDAFLERVDSGAGEARLGDILDFPNGFENAVPPPFDRPRR